MIPPRAYSHRTQRGPVGALHDIAAGLSRPVPAWWALLFLVLSAYLACALVTARMATVVMGRAPDCPGTPQ